MREEVHQSGVIQPGVDRDVDRDRQDEDQRGEHRQGGREEREEALSYLRGLLGHSLPQRRRMLGLVARRRGRAVRLEQLHRPRLPLRDPALHLSDRLGHLLADLAELAGDPGSRERAHADERAQNQQHDNGHRGTPWHPPALGPIRARPQRQSEQDAQKGDTGHRPDRPEEPQGDDRPEDQTGYPEHVPGAPPAHARSVSHAEALAARGARGRTGRASPSGWAGGGCGDPGTRCTGKTARPP